LLSLLPRLALFSHFLFSCYPSRFSLSQPPFTSSCPNSASLPTDRSSP
jgi:hypothetical protein